MFRNKIPETLKPGCLCNGMKTLISDHDYELNLGGTAKPGIQKTLDCRGDLRYPLLVLEYLQLPAVDQKSERLLLSLSGEVRSHDRGLRTVTKAAQFQSFRNFVP